MAHRIVRKQLRRPGPTELRVGGQSELHDEPSDDPEEARAS